MKCVNITLMCLFLSVITMLVPNLGNAQSPIIIDHNCTTLADVPIASVDYVKSNYRLWYGHTSHGGQLISGMGTWESLYGTQYEFNTSGSGGALSVVEPGGDLGHTGSLTWEIATRAQLDLTSNDRNVVMWSWCGGAGDNTEAGINIYLNAMNQLEIDYPGVIFIYMTGHLDGTGVAGNLNVRNEQIRAFCQANNKILFDFADIESYDPDGNYFLDLYATDACDYNGGNWVDEWCAAYPGSEYCTSCSCAHSLALNCNLKGAAFWWMMARISGWDPDGSEVPAQSTIGIFLTLLIISLCIALPILFKRS